MKKSFLFALTALLLLTVSCKKTLNEKNLTDTWEMTRVTIFGFEIPLGTLGTITMELKKDGSGTYSLDGQDTPIDAWTLNDETLSLTMGGQTINYNVAEYDGDILKIETAIDTSLFDPDDIPGIGLDTKMVQEFTRQE